MIAKRVYVEKKQGFRVESIELLKELNESLSLTIDSVRVLNIYDLFDVSSEKIDLYVNEVLTQKATDVYYYDLNLEDEIYFADEYLPGQFDQRAHSAKQCIKLIDSSFNGNITSGRLYIFSGINKEQLDKVKEYLINAVEKREKDLLQITDEFDLELEKIKVFDDFSTLDEVKLQAVIDEYGLVLNLEDMLFIQEYIASENKSLTETELLLLDTYWSDHCRHTTFETKLENISFSEDEIGHIIKSQYERYLKMRDSLNYNDRPITMMDMATIVGKYQRSNGMLDDLEISEEVNASSIFVDVVNDGKEEKWLLMLKNETHNHPTEIEPYGGASTCVGGAIRDPLSGRSYVYQAMRISGSGNPFEDVSDTLANKLSQRKISQISADGFSGYGNQIGLTTTFVREIVDVSYKAKHLEVGAVVGAVKASDIKRETPTEGDVVILLGGRTGRDGIGGATGSSKELDEDSLKKLGAQVQKGNAIEERKIQRLFRNSKVSKLIKKCNDFGAGGVAVSIGEIADSIDIDLDKVLLKYEGLNGTEITLSESQERMSVVVSKEDSSEFLKYAQEENLEACVVARVTANDRLKITWNNQVIVDLKKSFIDSGGVRRSISAEVVCSDVNFSYENDLYELMQDDNIAAQKGLVEMFDSTIGATTVLSPYGGKNCLTPSQVGVQKLPVLSGKVDTCSILSYGFNPIIAKQSAFHSAMYAVIESASKVVASGGSLKRTRLSFQEYFPKLGEDSRKWGLPIQALLGAQYSQNELEVAAIGGKDSMSGTFKDIDVIPTLISFALCPGKTNNIISPEFKKSGNFVYLFKHRKLENGIANFKQLNEIFKTVECLINEKKVISASAVEYGAAVNMTLMGFGNDIFPTVVTDEDLYEIDYGSIIVECVEEINDSNAVLLGTTGDELIINNQKYDTERLKHCWLNRYDMIYKNYNEHSVDVIDKTFDQKYEKTSSMKAKAFIPVFPGTNCEYDMQRAFDEVGIESEMFVFKNSSNREVDESITSFAAHVDECTVLVLSGGFSAADEPDGSGKYITSILNNKDVRKAVEGLLARDGLIIGICNGFQALVKCGLLPYGKYDATFENSPTLFRNSISRHISQFVHTKVMSNASAWLSSFEVGDVHQVPISHGEGQFVVDEVTAKELFDNGQVAFCYCDEAGNITGSGATNPNGSYYAIEGLVSPCGQILGKMAHSERYSDDLYKNIANISKQRIFENAANYFKGVK